MVRTRFSFLAPLALSCLAGLSAPLGAQSWEINDEIEFAKSMARYRLFDLSSEHLDRLARTDLEDDDTLAILYARALLFKIAGEYASTFEERMGYLDQATAGYEDFLSRARDTHDQFDLAQGEAADVQSTIGRMLAEQLAAGEGDEATKEKAAAAFRKAIERLLKELNRKRAAYEALDTSEMDEEQQTAALVEAYTPMYLLTQTYYEFAQLYEPGEFDREQYLTSAVETAEEFLWEVPSDRFIVQQVYRYAGLAYVGLGEPEEGFTRLNFVVDKNTGLPAWLENPDLPPAAVSQIMNEIEKTYLAITQSYNEAGQYADTEKAVAGLQDLYDRHADKGATKGPYGEECMIELGRALHMQGKAEGMALLQDVANRHASDTLGAKAASAIGSILEGSGRSSTSVIPATVWLTAAIAAQEEGKFFDSLDNFHKAIAARDTVSDETEQRRILVDAWSSIGKLYRGENRLVEAKAAFEAGLAVNGLDDEQKKALGSGLFNTLQRRYRETRSREDERAKNDSMEWLKKIGLEEMGFLLARDDFEAARVIPEDQEAKRKEAFKEAVKSLKDVPKNDQNYERALILLARCEAEQGDYDKALKEIEDYFERIGDSRYALGGTERVKIRNREISTTEATYYKADYEAKQEKHAEVLATLTGFEEKFPEQDKFFTQVNYLRLRSYLALEPPQIAEAEKLFEEKYAVGQLPLEAQYFLARALLDRADKAEEAGETDKVRELRSRGSDHMFQFCKNSGFNSYSNLKIAGDGYASVGEWAKAEEVYLKLVEQFGRNAAYRERIEKQVKRSLASAQLAQDKFQQAADLYRELLETFKDTPDRGLMMDAALAFGGRVDVVDGRVQEIPGSGDYKDAVELWDEITEKGFRREDKETLPWWEAKYYAIYTRYRARDLSPEWVTGAKKIVQNLKTTSLTFYKRPGTDIIEWEEVFEGQPAEVVADWKARYEYLFDRLR